jgi:hypothetical protein
VSSDFDFGIEVALSWLGQLEARAASLKDPFVLVDAVKSVLGEVHLVLLEVFENTTVISHSDLDLPPQVASRMCRPRGFFGKLSRIRFTRFWARDDAPISTVQPEMESLVAVPVFVKQVPGGCLAAVTNRPDHILGPTEAMVLSLAAAVYVLSREID